jgi:hypothetical protein
MRRRGGASLPYDIDRTYNNVHAKSEYQIQYVLVGSINSAADYSSG